MNLSIIIITYNSEKYIGDCLESLASRGLCLWRRKARRRGADTRTRANGMNLMEIIVVDNDSRDGTIGIINGFKPRIENLKLVENKGNLGFAKANNLGAKIAEGDWLLFLNPDTIMKESGISKITKLFESEPQAAGPQTAGVVGFKLRNPDGSLQYSAGKFATILNLMLNRIPILNKIFYAEQIRRDGFYEKERSVDWVCGAAMMVRKDIFEKLGGFCDDYFMYWEDQDLCFRIKKAGYEVKYNPFVEIIHFDEGRSAKRKKAKREKMKNGALIFFKKYRSKISYYILKLLFVFV